LSRLSKVSVLKSKPEPYELKAQDEQWNSMLPLELVPHPKNIEFPTAIELDYNMEYGGLALSVRAAMAGYLLRRWNVDCSENAELLGPEFQLHLQNTKLLQGAENLAIAPDYEMKMK